MIDSAANVESSRFRTTHWSIIMAAGVQDTAVASHALQRLCQTYWYPLYAFARRQGESPHDAQDMVQGFFEQFISKAFLDDVDPEKGRFRSFLLASLKHYMGNQWRKAKRQKRGAGFTMVSIDARVAEDQYSLDPGHDLSPDRIFDRSWVITLLDTVLQRLRSEYAMSGKEDLFDTLKSSLTERKTDVSRAEQATVLGLSEAAVKVAVHRLRKRYQKCLYETVAETLQNPAEIESEIRALFAALQ